MGMNANNPLPRAVHASTDPKLFEFAELVGTTGPVGVEGGRSRWSTGGEPKPNTRLVRAPTGIVEYKADEMTVRVRTGTTVAELHTVLGQNGQQTALPQRQPQSTVGGAIAVGENDLDMLAKGALRTCVLQVRYVSADGKIITGGGPTVKNVSGFDIPRLMVGSLGTLGLLGEVVLRTNPTPEVDVWLEGELIDPFPLRYQLASAACILWNGEQVWVHLTGHRGVVESDRAILRSLASFNQIDAPPALPPHRWSMPPKNLQSLAGAAKASRGGTVPTGDFMASVGTGLVWANQQAPRRPLDPTVLEINQKLKANFDPTGRLNPGRNPSTR